MRVLADKTGRILRVACGDFVPVIEGRPQQADDDVIGFDDEANVGLAHTPPR